jgi:hypothetical protein
MNDELDLLPVAKNFTTRLLQRCQKVSEWPLTIIFFKISYVHKKAERQTHEKSVDMQKKHWVFQLSLQSI